MSRPRALRRSRHPAQVRRASKPGGGQCHGCQNTKHTHDPQTHAMPVHPEFQAGDRQVIPASHAGNADSPSVTEETAPTRRGRVGLRATRPRAFAGPFSSSRSGPGEEPCPERNGQADSDCQQPTHSQASISEQACKEVAERSERGDAPDQPVGRSSVRAVIEVCAAGHRSACGDGSAAT